MKKSNQLLLGGFLTVVLLIVAFHATIYAKFRNKNYSLYTPTETMPQEALKNYSNVSYVHIVNVPHAIVQFTDSAQLQDEAEEELVYMQKGDSLIITGKEIGYQQQSKRRLVFKVPHNSRISVINSSIDFRTGKDVSPSLTDIVLHHAEAVFPDLQSVPKYSSLRILASDSSTIRFNGDTRIGTLDITLSQSTIDHGLGEIDQLSIRTDEASRISFQSKHLLKAKITTTTAE